MPNHEVTLGDVFTLVTEVKSEVTAISATLETVKDASKDHEVRIREVERTKSTNEELSQVKSSVDEIKKKLYAMSGGAVVISIIANPFINQLLGK